MISWSSSVAKRLAAVGGFPAMAPETVVSIPLRRFAWPDFQPPSCDQ